MLAEQRYREILNLMRIDGSVKVSTLREHLKVSSETIRRDLENMEANGLLRRTHGGAFLLDSHETTDLNHILYAPFDEREQRNINRKLEVARLAADYIKEGQSVALDSGSTSRVLARVIKERFNNLTVVTNSMAVFNELEGASGFTLVMTGGIYKSDELAFTTEIATLIFSKLSIDIFFLTTCGISVDRGVTYQRMDEIIVQDKMMEVSEKTIVIADSSKLGVNSLVKMCDIDQIDMIITDSVATEDQIELFKKANVNIIKPKAG